MAWRWAVREGTRAVAARGDSGGAERPGRCAARRSGHSRRKPRPEARGPTARRVRLSRMRGRERRRSYFVLISPATPERQARSPAEPTSQNIRTLLSCSHSPRG
jgi:hypothetical protein